MSEDKQYWIVDEEDKKHGLLTLNDPDKHFRCYIKYDGMIHLWLYDDEYGFDCDTGVYGVEAKKTSHHSYYYCIGMEEELDTLIARLQAIKQYIKP